MKFLRPGSLSIQGDRGPGFVSKSRPASRLIVGDRRQAPALRILADYPYARTMTFHAAPAMRHVAVLEELDVPLSSSSGRSSDRKDLARALSVLSVRVVEVIPGKNGMGLEIAEQRELVTFGEIVRSKAYDDISSPLALVLGKDIGGQPAVADLFAKMPHLLVAGTTGSGQSVAINAMDAVVALQEHRRARCG